MKAHWQRKTNDYSDKNRNRIIQDLILPIDRGSVRSELPESGLLFTYPTFVLKSKPMSVYPTRQHSRA